LEIYIYMLKYKCSQASKEEWIAAAKSCPYATYFHTPYWYDLIAPKQEHSALSVRFDDGASAILPLARISRFGGLLIDRFSSPGGNYGGWIGESALSEEHAAVILGILMSKKNLTFRVNPFDPSSRFIGIDSCGSILKAAAFKIQIKDEFTHVLDLTKGERAITLGLSKGHRSAIKSAARAGVTVKAAQTRLEWERYYELYLDSVERWRAGKLTVRAVYPASLFNRLYENRTENEILWIALKDGEPVAGALIFYWNGHAVSWHASASSRHLGLRPNNLLYWEIISDALRRGCRVFDFNPSGGYGGVESFKSHFGAQRLPAPMITTRSPIRRMLAGLRGR
jgi:hypothetical protein